MWEQQNLYIIRGLRMYGYDKEADALKSWGDASPHDIESRRLAPGVYVGMIATP